MNLSRIFIERPVMTTLVMVAILFFGIMSYLSLPVSDLPPVAYPTIVVTGQNPGSDAATMAATIATPLEKQLMAIPGLRTIISASNAGETQITLSFDLDVEIADASTRVAEAISQATGDLPIDQMPNPPTYDRYNPTDTPIIWVAISSETMTMGDLYDYGNTAIAQRISMLSGVSQVDVYGAKKAVRVELDPDAIAYRGIGINEIANSLKAANQNQPGGTVYDQIHQVTLEPFGQLESGTAFEDLIVAYRDNGPVRVSDIGRAIDSTEDDQLWMQYWDRDQGAIPSIVIGVLKEPKANAVSICDTIVNMIPELEASLPGSISLHVMYNQADLIKASLFDVKFTLCIAFLLVVLVIFLFLGNITATIIPLAALPMSMIGTFALMFLLGYNLDILSLMALTLVVGFLVDDAIVVLENIVRHMEMGKPPKEAAMDGSKQISTTVLSMTLSLAAVFIPLIFMPGIIGRMFHEFGMVTVIAVLFSGGLALTLTPMLASRFLKPSKHNTRVSRMSDWIMDKLSHIYAPLLRKALGKGWIPVGSVMGACVIAALLYLSIPLDFLPPGDTGAIQGVSIATQGVSPEKLAILQAKATNIIKQNSAVRALMSVTNIGGFAAANQGLFFVMLEPTSKRPPIDLVTYQLMEDLGPVIGINAFLKPFPEINLEVGTGAAGARANYQYALSTLGNPDILYESAEKLLAEMRKIPELADVSSDAQIANPQLNIELLRDQATTYGISADAIETALTLCYAEGRLDTFSTSLDTYWVILQLQDKYKGNVEALEKVYLAPDMRPSSDSQLVPLRSVVDWEMTTGPLTVNHVNQFVSATLFFNLREGAALSTAMQKIEAVADNILPPQIIRDFEGTAQVFAGTMPLLIALVVVGFIVIYLLLGILYESFIHPITILSALPGALFGALITLFIFRDTLSIYAFVGIIVLVGIVMKNGIMLVEFAKELVDQGKDAQEAIFEAAMIRFRPILMTTIAAGMGALPIALGIGAGGDARRPLGLVIIGGLIFAQLITYFFTPVVYYWFELLQEKFKRKKV